MYLNQVTMVGRLCHTPNKYLKALPSGVQTISIPIAHNKVWKDKDGQKQEKALFHNLVFFGRNAEILAQYCVKGQEILVTGELETRSWDKNDGTKGYMTEIRVSNFQMGAKPLNSSQEQGQDEDWENEPQSTPKEAPRATQAQPEDKGFEYPTEEINPEDIPF